ncbi:DUF5988 family protein [Streptomyces sp. NBC_00237]|uniref:DUF5988 family protein n=1 Tax=Streptomyces sp. NBC_00237 TaxID=2975687 RepID=UPI002256EA37|nr:DUF5988 family protein [Streptomyces sp. NBC_00237]MCX5203210.1 DUF5988 family protein [Streptomyces sp. NBC_00237]
MATSSVQLQGGPGGLSGSVELTDLEEVIFSTEKIKIRYGNGYEHFEPVRAPLHQVGSGAVSELMTFQWVGRTKIAE